MKKDYFFKSLLCFFLLLTQFGFSQTDLFISEYIEGGGNNKCIEIYNGTGAAIDLAAANYTLARYSNGGTSPTNIALTGIVADGDVFVICNSSGTLNAAMAAQADQFSGSISHNGDDAYSLSNNGTVIDVFGHIGQDPGSEWSQGGNTTANNTLVRNPDVLGGNTDDLFGFPSLAIEWTQFPSDYSADLGMHTINTPPAGPADLFISEYIEGGGNNKCIEIYNGTGSSIDLAAGSYSLARYSNGGTTPTNIFLTGTIADGDVHVICNSSGTLNAAMAAQADQFSGSISHNGDDAYSLSNNGTVIDVFGHIGQDPGSEWSQGGNTTANNTLIRNPDIIAGNTDDLFDFPSLATEWAQFPSDYSADLGSHTTNTGGCTPTSLTLDIATLQDLTGDCSVDAPASPTATNDCGTQVSGTSDVTFPITATGTTTVTWFYDDGEGNTTSQTQDVVINDATAPNAIAQDVTVTLDASGNGTLTAAEVDNGSDDACSAVTLSIDNTSFSCSDIAAPATTTDLFISEYIEGSGNNKCIEIYNGTGASIDLATANYTLARYSNGGTSPTNISLTGTVADGDVYVICTNSGTLDSAMAVQADQLSGSISHNGDDAYSLSNNGTVIDVFGHIGQDPGSEWSQGGNTTANNTLIRNSAIMAGNTDDIFDFPSLATEWAQFPSDYSADLGSHTIDSGGGPTVNLTVTDANGNSATATANVTVVDDTLPTATCQAVTLQLDASGNATLDPADVDNGSTDACGVASLALSQTTFDCSHIGTNTVTLTVTDNNGNESTCTATITVEDNEAPNVIAQNVTVTLDASGNGTLTAAEVDNGSNDACSTVTLSIENTAFDCSDIAAPAVTGDLFISEYIEGSGNNKCIEIYNGTGASIDLAAGNYSLARYSNGGTSPTNINLTGIVADGDVYVICNSSGTLDPLMGAQADQLSGSISHNGDDAYSLSNNGAVIDVFGHIGQDPGSEWSQGGNTTANNTLVRNSSVMAGNTDDLLDFPSLATEWTEFASNYSADLGSHTIDSGGGPTVTLTVTDANGNSASETVNVTVEDITPPTAICQNITVQLDAGGVWSTGWGDINNNSTDACGIATYLINGQDSVEWTCADIGVNTAVLTVIDNSGNESTCNATVTVVDNEAPTAICNIITVELDATGNYTLNQTEIDAIGAGSSDACGAVTFSVDNDTFDCDNVIANAVVIPDLMITEYVEGSSSNKYIEIYNGTGGAINLSDYELRLYSNGNSSPSTTNTLSGTLSNGNTIVYRNSSAAIYGGPSTVLSAVNWNGDDAIELWKISTSTAVDIFGKIGEDPGSQWGSTAINETQNQTLRRNSDVLQGNTDDLSGFPALQTEWTELAIDDVSGLGSHTLDTGNTDSTEITLTVTDLNGNSSTCTTTIIVEDNIAPTASCQSVTVQLDANGNGTLAPEDVDNGSTDVCGIASLALSQTDFDCSHIGGTNEVTLTVTDVNGNSSTCTANVTVVDSISPTVICQNVTVELDASGNATITAADIDNGSTDACGIASIAIDVNSFDCSNIATNPGEINDLFISEYIEGSSSNKYIEIYNGTGADVNLSGYELRLHSNGNPSPSNTNTLSGTLANGATIVYRNTNANIYDGPTTVSSAVNWNGDDAIVLWNIAANEAIDIFGKIGQDPGSQWQVGTVETQNQTLRRNQAVTEGNTDDITGFPSLGTEWTEFAQDDVSGLGSHSAGLGNNVILTVTDNNGNLSTCTVAVTVVDSQTPTITCPGDIEVDNDLGVCGAVVTYDVLSDDNCSGSLTVQQTEGLASGEVFPVGTTTNTFVVTDAGGNTETCSFDVTVEDNEAPVVNCAEITIVLDNNGEVDIVASDLNNNSSDNCEIASYTISQENFTCADTGGDLDQLIISQYIDGPDANDCLEIYNGTGNSVELTGNYSIIVYTNGATSGPGVFVWPLLGTISADDTYVVCQQFSDAEATGNVDLINGIMFNGNDAISLNYNGNAVDILGIIGNNPGIEWTAGGISTKNTSLTRKDDVFAGNIANDNSGLASEWSQTVWSNMSGLGTHDIETVGLANNVLLTVTDIYGNSSTCEASVTVVDDTPPTAIAQDVIVELDASGNGSTSGILVNNGSSDVCGIASLTLDQTDFTCANVGSANPVVLTVTDVNGNTATATANVTVIDGIAPDAVAQDVVVVLDAAGNGSVTAAQVNNGSSDACGVDTVTVSPNTFDCSNVGDNEVTLVVTDVNGNVSTATANVDVQDNTNPNAVCQALTVTLDANGSATIVGADVDGGSTDACGIASYEVDMDTFDCSHLGDNTVTLTVTDNNGNVSSCMTTVTVVGDVITDLTVVATDLPEFCQGAVIELTASSTLGVTYDWSTGESGESIEVGANGDYTVTATSATNCTATFTYSVTGFDPGALTAAYTIIATDEVHLHGDNLVQTGGVGVTKVNKKIKVHKASNIVEFAQASIIEVDGSSTVGTEINSPANPTIPTFLYNNESTNSSPDYRVRRNQTRTIGGSVYDKIEVEDNATLIFTSSNIYIDELKTKKNATIIFAACANVFINKKIKFDKNTTFNPDGNMVTVYVDDKFEVKEGSNVIARVHANDHEIKVKGKKNGSSTFMTGLFIGKKVKGNDNVVWNQDTLCEPCPIIETNDHSAPSNNHHDDDDDGHHDDDDHGHGHDDDDDGDRQSFDVKAWPNPSNTSFNVQLESANYIDDATIYVFDMNNKLVHTTEFGAEDKYNFGNDLEGGVYIVKVVQGKNMKHVRLVKY